MFAAFCLVSASTRTVTDAMLTLTSTIIT